MLVPPRFEGSFSCRVLRYWPRQWGLLYRSYAVVPPCHRGSTALGLAVVPRGGAVVPLIGASGSTAGTAVLPLSSGQRGGNGWFVPPHYIKGSSSPKLTYLFPQKLHCCSKLHFRPISLPSQSNLLICSGLVEKAQIYTSTKRNLIPPTNP